MEYGFNVKRRKGLEDGDVGDSVNYTTLLDELERLDEMASTTTDPETFSVLVRQVDLIRQQILGFIILQQQQQTKPKLWRFFGFVFSGISTLVDIMMGLSLSLQWMGQIRIA